MKFSKLNTKIRGILTAGALSLVIVSCNNADESAKNSTGTSESDTSSMKDAKMTVTKKKSGKISSSMSTDNTTMKMEKDKDGIYNYSEVLPAYAGGQSAIDNYITSNIEYPQEAIDNNIEGVVNVQFAVDEKGNVTNVTTKGEKLGHGLEEESVKVVSNMKWTPGEIKGKKVKTWRTLPINYRLES